jgi:hypothetical protein
MPDMDIDEMRRTLARVNVYRQVREAVRESASGTLFSAVIYLAFGGFLYNAGGAVNQVIAYAFLGLGVGELLIGIWKKIAPSPECILADAIMEFAFVGYLLYRVTGGFAGVPKNLNPITLFVGGLAIYNGINHFRHYFYLRSVFVERPTSEHIAYVENLKAEVAEGNPENDTSSIEIPTRPLFKAKLMGDVAFFLIPKSGELFLVRRDEMQIARLPRGGGTAYKLGILLEAYEPCDLDSASWDNYAAWKSAGGEPPPPITALPRKTY